MALLKVQRVLKVLIDAGASAELMLQWRKRPVC